MAIIAILSAIMFGPIQTARLRAKDTKVVADMKLIKSYLDLYAMDHDGLYPYILDESSIGIYGPLPNKIKDFDNSSSSTYNYIPICVGNESNIVGYELWTSLSGPNEALKTDSDCTDMSNDSTCWNLYYSRVACGDGMNYYEGALGTTQEDNCNVNKDHCVLDYAGGTN